MKKLAWDTSFRKAFKRRARNNPGLQDRILEVLDLTVIGSKGVIQSGQG
jgi:mRNA-degrading endonuclease YafQ of YafQ-DinJ toxin-antitoxin module